ncbi:MAG TPA: HEAT repeat domain-containing protein [Pyrinomonadaceae bacterium]|nr:HEAT repeat domain-containing protein [Pyrinomonadaceae bacterium]
MKVNLLKVFILSICIAINACARSDSTTLATASAETGSTPSGEIEQSKESQSAATTIQSFKAVEGADLSARLEAAKSQGRSGQTPYWSAYAFDVRPGVAVDPGINEFHGSMHTIGDTAVFVGTTASGMTVETRNLAIFLLREAGNNQVSRMEVYNLERKREYSGYPVYWLGRANNEESLNFLRGLADSAPLTMLSERAVLGISLHDDQRVASLLKNFIRTSQNQRVRSASVYWLGQIGGEQAFLADLVRNESEDMKVRRQAAHAIGESRDRGAISMLQTLFDSVKEPDVRRAIINAAGDNHDKEAALAFLLKVARSDPDKQVRRSAVRQLGEFKLPNIVDELNKIYANESEPEVKRAVLHALAETKSPGAQARLLELARKEPNDDLRKRAIHVLAERGEAAVDDLIGLYDSERTPEVRRSILRSLAEIKATKVEDKLLAVASGDESIELRRQAIRLLGERAGKRSLDFLSAAAQSADGNTEVQIQAVRAISERNADEAVPLLIKIAKTHSNQLVRKQAIRALGESGDPRAVDFFREVLAK